MVTVLVMKSLLCHGSFVTGEFPGFESCRGYKAVETAAGVASGTTSPLPSLARAFWVTKLYSVAMSALETVAHVIEVDVTVIHVASVTVATLVTVSVTVPVSTTVVVAIAQVQ